MNEGKKIEKKTSGNLTKLYIIALTAVAILTITGQLLIQNAIENQLTDSHIVNMAGKQRYMSQQISKVVLLIYGNIDHQNYQDKIQSLKSLLHDWEKNHLALQFGNPELNLEGENSEQVTSMFKDLAPVFENMRIATNRIIEIKENPVDVIQDKNLIKENLRLLLRNEKIFLNGMDNIVHQYDKEAKAKVIFLRKVELVLLVLTMIILLLEGLFVFRPAVKTIKTTIDELIASETMAHDLAKKLMSANKSLEISLKDLKDVNYALDYATILAKTDKYGNITFVNDKFCQVSGYTREDLIGKKFDMINGQYHSQKFFAEMWNVISKGKIWNSEIKNKSKDGTYFWLDATIVPVLDNNMIPDQYLAIYTDVTQRFKQSINEQKIRTVSIIEGQEKERRKIARELHDGLGQMLTALKFNIEGIKGAPTKKEKQNLVDIRQFTLETIREVRRISFNLMPSVLSDFGLIPAIKHLTDQVSKHSGILIIFEHNSLNTRFNKTIEISLYRILQEALNNAVKYAKATEVRIFLGSDDQLLYLEIFDNGIGFDRKITNNKDIVGSGNGISNIQERTSLLNGEFTIDSSPGNGTKIRIDIPLTPNT